MSHKKIRLNWRIRTARVKSWEAAADRLGMNLGEFIFWSVEQAVNNGAVDREVNRRHGRAQDLAQQAMDIARDLGDIARWGRPRP